jgi:hypothetical protein
MFDSRRRQHSSTGCAASAHPSVAQPVMNAVFHDIVTESDLGELPLQYFLLYCARCDEAVHVDAFLLAVAVDTCHGLLVGGGVPVGFEEDDTVGCHQVEADTTCFGREKEEDWVKSEKEEEI